METASLQQRILQAWARVHLDTKLAAQEATRLLKEAEMTEQDLPIAQAQITLAFCYAHESKNAEALDLVNRAIHTVKTYQDVEWHVNANRVIGYVYSSLGDLKQSSDAFEEGLALINEHQLPIDPHYLNNLGFIYYELGEYEQAHQQLVEALRIAEEQQHDIIPLLLSNLADLQILFGEIDIAEDYNRRAYNILLNRVSDRNSLAQCHSIFGIISRHKKEWDAAFESFQKSLSIYREQEAKYAEATILIDLGNLYFDQEQFETALTYYKQSLDISVDLQAILLQRDILQKMSETYHLSADYQAAYKHLIEFNKVNDQIKTKEVKDQISRYMTEAKVDQMQKDAEIERLRNIELTRLSEENALRAQILEDSYQDLKIISEIGRRIIANQENAEVLYSVYMDLYMLMEADIFGLCLYNKDLGEVEYKAFVEQGQLLTLKNKSIDNKTSLSVQCIRENHEIHLTHAVSNKDFTLREAGLPNIYPQSLHFFPMVMNDEVIGAITIQSYKENAFSERQIEMLRLLALYITIAMSNMMKSEQLQLQTRQLEELTKKDPLTNLYNMRHMKKLLTEAMTNYQKTQVPFSIIVIDLDHFKEINDSYGHSCGDHVLQEISHLFKTSIHQNDFAARWGGEEFLLLLTNTNLEEARTFGNTLLKTIEQSVFEYQDQDIQVTATMGVATYSSKDWHVDELIERADKALYIGKDGGRNQVVVYSGA